MIRASVPNGRRHGEERWYWTDASGLNRQSLLIGHGRKRVGGEDPTVSTVGEKTEGQWCHESRQETQEEEQGWGVGKTMGSAGDMLCLKHCQTEPKLESSWMQKPESPKREREMYESAAFCGSWGSQRIQKLQRSREGRTLGRIHSYSTIRERGAREGD